MSEAKSEEFRPFQSTEARERYLERYAQNERSWPVVFESRIVHTDRGEAFVRISGPADATSLVLLPGGLSSSLVWPAADRASLSPVPDDTRLLPSTMRAAACHVGH